MGFSVNFIPGLNLDLPEISDADKSTLAPLISNPGEHEIKHTHFSVVVNKDRKLAWYAATNIDGKKWKATIKERLEFKKDAAIKEEYQTGDELYDFYKSRVNNDFDKGHIAKFQDPQWGDTDEIVKKGADDSMKFTNCLPQHHSLNRGAWKSLEDYIVKKFTIKDGVDGQKISIFAGPVLSAKDPYYIDLIEGNPYQVPCHFWKVIVYRNLENKLTAVGFIMSQQKILKKQGFITDRKKDIHPAALAAAKAIPDFFTDFKKGEPYQVKIDFIEKVTGLSFGVDDLNQPYQKTEPQEIIYKRTEVKKAAALSVLSYGEAPPDFKLLKIAL